MGNDFILLHENEYLGDVNGLHVHVKKIKSNIMYLKNNFYTLEKMNA